MRCKAIFLVERLMVSVERFTDLRQYKAISLQK
jgi:hypothetical protein